MNLDLEQLITFERIVREGSFSAAAVALDLPQPTVSARIKSLEQAIGGSLFLRQGRKITLTDLGQAFLPYAQRSIAILSEGVEMARQTNYGQRGRVTFGGLTSLSGELIGGAVAAFHQTHPQVELLIKGSDHELVVDWLRDRVIELGLIVWPCPESTFTPMEALLRFREPVVLVVGARHPLAGRTTITYEELVESANPFFSLRWWKTMHPIITKIASQVENITASTEVARHMIRSGYGMGFFTRLRILDDLQTGALVELKVQDLPPITRDTALVWLPRETPLSPAAQAFVVCIRERALQLGIEQLSRFETS
ncbi:MAG: LysR family transcriptional regulator [Anaerolineae bacterium]